MTAEARRGIAFKNLCDVVEKLTEFSAEGNVILKKTRNSVDPLLQEEIEKWEASVATYLRERLGHPEELLFLSDAALETYDILSATAGHREILDRVNTRVVRLNVLIEKLNNQVMRAMGL
jgi:hypothetical protein